MDVEFFGFVDIFVDVVEDDYFEEMLNNGGFGGDKDMSGLVVGIGWLFVGFCYLNDVFLVWDCGEDFEGFWEGIRFVVW